MEEIEFQRRKGLRRLRMSFDFRNQLVVAVPWNCSRAEAERFVESNRSWIDRQRAKLAPVQTLSEFLRSSSAISINGKRIAVEIRIVEAGAPLWIFDETRTEGLFHIPQQVDFEAALMTLFRKLAATVLADRVEKLSHSHGFDPKQVTVRDQKSRWGSCSCRGTISLNWRLLLVSPAIQDYVILHELAHLTHMNHSPKFYALLSRLDPNREEHEAELSQESSRLMRVGRY